MMNELPVFLRRKPSTFVAWAVAMGTVVLWGIIRMFIFSDAAFPLTYTLPLLICIWTRRKRLLWIMAGIFAFMAVVKFELLLPSGSAPQDPTLHLLLPTLINISVGVAAVHLIILLLARLEKAFDDLAQINAQVRQQNDELAQQTEELSMQNEELAQQSEELSQQNEELQAQSEELQVQSEDIQTLNVELSGREEMLQKLLDSSRLVSSEQTVITDLCIDATRLFGDAASAVVIYEIQAGLLSALAQTGLDTQISGPWPLESSFMDLTIRENRTACLHDTSLRPDLWTLKVPEADAFRSVLCSPMHSESKSIGAITIYCRHTQEWSDHHFRLAEWVAAQCGNALQTIRMQRALRESEETARQRAEEVEKLMNLAPTAIWVSRDPHCHTITGNTAANRFYESYENENVSAGPDPDVHDTTRRFFRGGIELRPEKLPMQEAAAKCKDILDSEMDVLLPSGKTITILGNASPLLDAEGQVRGCVGSFVDITGRKKAEEELRRHRDHLEELVKERTIELETRNKQLEDEVAERRRAEKEKKDLENQLIQAQKMEALGRFAGGIAHDLNNILYPIIINTEMLMEETGQDTPLHKTLEQMLQAAYRQRDLIKQILSFSRRKEKQFSPTEVTPLIEETLVLLRSSLPSIIEIRHNFNATDDSILADPTQIQQIIMNLCKNAADSIDSKKGVIEVSLLNTLLDSADHGLDIKPGNYLQLSVEDSGCGMDPEILPHIFEPFFTTKDVGKGSGMGLAVVHGILKDHGGTITVESTSGKGSRFIAYLPLTNERAHDRAADGKAALPGSGKGKILLIDDEDIILSSVSKALDKLGYDVHPIKSSVEALQLFAQSSHAFDLVITDLTMPQMNGLELSSRITDIRPNIPVILCTGFSDTIDECEIKSLGIRELLMKPAGTRELKEVIRRALEN